MLFELDERQMPRNAKNPITNRFVKGLIPWNKGLKMKYKSEESKAHSFANLRMSSKDRTKQIEALRKVKCIPVVGVTKDGKYARFESARDASNKLGINASNIGSVILKRPSFKTAGGLMWFREDSDEWLKYIV